MTTGKRCTTENISLGRVRRYGGDLTEGVTSLMLTVARVICVRRYHGRCVSGKKFENKYCFLVGFRNAVHIWTSSENMVYDEPPSSGMLYEGLDVLVSTPTPEGGERYSKGCVNETLPNDVYIVRVLRDDRATSEVPLAKIRLLPRREPPTFGEKWMKRISLATKINQSKFADPSGL
eukprot:m.264257 g.264257  ORF g.264257 m.264257 type:complete len:177 (-) comp26721_c0_seq18:1569-2099(-)